LEFSANCPSCDKNKALTNAADCDISKLVKKIKHHQEYAAYKQNCEIQLKLNILNDRLYFASAVAKTNNVRLEQQINAYEYAVISAKIEKLEAQNCDLHNAELHRSLLEKIQRCDQNEVIETQNKVLRDENNIIAAVLEYREYEIAIKENEKNRTIIDELTSLRDANAIQIEKIQLTESVAAIEIRGKMEALQVEIQNYADYKKLQNKKIICENNLILMAEIANLDKIIAENATICMAAAKVEKALELQIAKVTAYQKTANEKKALEKQKSVFKHYIKLIDMKTGIPHKILQHSCSALIAGVNNILEYISDFRISINFDLKNFTIMILKGEMAIPSTQGSGLQKFIIDVAIRIYLANNHAYLPNFLIVDEGFGCMDPAHLLNTKEFIQTMDAYHQFDWIIIISHIAELNDIAETQIKIAIENDVSRLVYGTIPDYLENIEIDEIDANTYDANIFTQDDAGFWTCLACQKSYKKNNDSFPIAHSKGVTHVKKLAAYLKANRV
jgi:hypothetical protein